MLKKNYNLKKSEIYWKKLFTCTNVNSTNIFTYLNNRNLIANISNQDLIKSDIDVFKILNKNPKVYIGFDPTAESLHLGNLIGILIAIKFAAFRIQPIFLIGGATAQIGDPSGKNKERPLMNKENIQKNLSSIEYNIHNLIENINSYSDVQNFFKYTSRSYSDIKITDSTLGSNDENEKLIEKNIIKSNCVQEIDSDNELFLKSMHEIDKENNLSKNMIKGGQFTYQIVNNIEFYKDLNIIDFLRDIGINLRMGSLLSRDLVKNRLNSKEGLSLTEFMYQSFQGYDYLKLFENFNVRVQIGGSDQWANMLAGYELIKKMKNTEVVNMTFPLMTSSNGQKFGKSEGNALFLNPELTPINNIYQYFFNIADTDLEKMFSAFTFIEKEEIDEVLLIHAKNPEKRTAQKILSEKIIGLLFSNEEAEKCKNNCKAHYTNLSTNKSEDLENIFKECQVTEISDEFLDKLTISNLCVNYKILPSKAQCKRLIQSGSLFINNSKVEQDSTLSKEMLIGGKYLILKTGKKNTHIFNFKNTQTIEENVSAIDNNN